MKLILWGVIALGLYLAARALIDGRIGWALLTVFNGPTNEIALASLAGAGVAVALVLVATELARLTVNRH